MLTLVCCLAGCAYRFVFIFVDDDPKPPDYNSVIFFLSTTFFLVFTLLAGLSFAPYGNKLGQWARSNFHFLDYYLGRGIFLFFVGLFLLEMPGALEITLFSIICVCVVVDLVVGCHEVNVRKAAEAAAGDAKSYAAGTYDQQQASGNSGPGAAASRQPGYSTYQSSQAQA